MYFARAVRFKFIAAPLACRTSRRADGCHLGRRTLTWDRQSPFTACVSPQRLYHRRRFAWSPPRAIADSPDDLRIRYDNRERFMNPDASPSDPPPRSISAAQRALLLVGSIGPIGYAPASGTVAVAVAGIPLCWLMHRYLSAPVYLAVSVAFALASMWMHHWGDRVLGESDSRKLVWDELAGYFFAMFLVPFGLKAAVVAFFLERFIDIVKVPPANWVDRRMHNGVGVVLDDVIAGIYTCAIMHLLFRYAAWLVV